MTNELGDNVTFTGTAIYDLKGNSYQPCDVEISGHSEWNQLGVDERPRVRFENGTTRLPFKINVSVPSGYIAGLKDVRFAGTYNLDSETTSRNIHPISALFNVTPYRNITLEARNPVEKTIAMGSSAAFHIRTINNGNTYDEVQLIIKEKEKFKEFGVELEFEKGQLGLGHEQQYVANMLCDVSVDAEPGTYEITVTSRSLSIVSEYDVFMTNEIILIVHVVESTLDHPGLFSVIISIMILLIPLIVLRRIRQH